MNDVDALEAAGLFVDRSTISGVVRWGTGHINDSFRITIARDGRSEPFFLQCINRTVFGDVERLMENVVRVTHRLCEVSQPYPELLIAGNGQSLVRDAAGRHWRLARFLDNTRPILVVENEQQAEQAARAYGRFLKHLSALSGPRLHEVIPGFHDTAARVCVLDTVIASDPVGRVAAARETLAWVAKYRHLPKLLCVDRLAERVVHNDAKIENVLFDPSGSEAICVVDLDTVMPGLAAWDFGDMVRTMTCSATEDEPDLNRVEICPSLFEAVERGYLAEAGSLLDAHERASLLPGAKVIIFEQAVRFLADYLSGDTYYKTTRPDQNLDRARVQLKLLDSLHDM